MGLDAGHAVLKASPSSAINMAYSAEQNQRIFNFAAEMLLLR